MSILLKLAEKKEEKKPGFFRRNKKKILIGAGTLAALTAAGYGLHKRTAGKGFKPMRVPARLDPDEHPDFYDKYLDDDWWSERSVKWGKGNRNKQAYDPDEIHRSGRGLFDQYRVQKQLYHGRTVEPTLSRKSKLIRMLPWNRKYKKFYEASDNFKNRPIYTSDDPLPKRNTPSREFIQSIIDGEI